MTSAIISTIIDECRKFAVNEIRSTSLEMDLSPDADRVRRIWGKSSQMDLPWLSVPEIFSGGGCTPLECAKILETLAAECAGVASIYAHHYCACTPLLVAHAEIQKKWFAKFIDPKNAPLMASVMLPEEFDESTLSWTKENGQCILNGKSPIFGSVMLADGFMVFPSETGHPENILCLWIDRAAAGVAFGEPLQLPGLKINSFGSILFNDVRVLPDHMMADGQAAQKMLSAARSSFYGFTAAIAVGAARRAFEKALDYAKERYQFGKKIILVIHFD